MSWGIVAVSVVAAGSIYQGVSAKQQADKQAKLVKEQGGILRDEAYVEAGKIREDGYKFAQEQTMAYLSSGVEITGTPLLLARETLSMAEEEARATEKRGDQGLDLAQKQGNIIKNEGRAQMISGIIGAGSAVAKGGYSGAFK